jgi:hypothetical protein
MLWRDLEVDIAANDYRVAHNGLESRFRATLDVFSYLANWSVGAWSSNFTFWTRGSMRPQIVSHYLSYRHADELMR